MANINETISEVAKLNPELARQIQKYVKNHSYGLVFEHNLPEAVRLYKKQPAVGDTVNILAPRGQKETEENSVPWCVKYIDNGIAYLEHDGEAKDVPLEDICVLVSYRDVIYPGLKEIDRIERGNPEDPYHMVINSENYHALEALAYAYAGKVDCIYIDPPYNKEDSKDWKYNCNYVDSNDKYRHSKWLVFMERRLKLAKQLLNPKESVLVVAIDEVEYARLALLLEQIFPESVVQMVTSMTNKKGQPREGIFSRCEEYLFFVFIGDAKITRTTENMLFDGSNDTINSQKTRKLPTIWNSLLRRGTGSDRKDVPTLFYPIFVDETTSEIKSIGEPLPLEEDRNNIIVPDGLFATFPMHKDGTEGRWQLKPDTLREYLKNGTAKLGKKDKKSGMWSIVYLKRKQLNQVTSGELICDGRDEKGALILRYPNDIDATSSVLLQEPRSLWVKDVHDASVYGSTLIKNILVQNNFSFPKSLYAVHDTLQFLVSDKSDALIVDFFAGSGTTLHAVNLLNAEDGGHRRCICVTNNEVSEAEEKKFVADGLRPSDTDWEKYGIANHVTWPRTVCSIEGHDVNGKPLEGDYGKPSKDIDLGYSLPKADGFKANAVFCELTYESAWPIRLDNAFNAIAPILWMQAGCQGPIIRKIGKSYLTTDYYGVLFDYGQASKFCEKVKNTPTIKTVFVVTDDQRRYSNMCKRLPEIEVHRLYETFLRTFEICGEGGID